MEKLTPYITVTVILYFIFSFVQRQFNPSMWTQDTRVMLVFMWVGLMCIVPLVQKMMKEI